jgi:transcriptional regulator with XRE-family HTH domain
MFWRMPITPYIYDQLYRGFADLRVTPDEPAEPAPPITVQRAPGWGRPHTGATVARVRYLFEHTDLTYAEIAAQTGVSRGVITQWKRRHRWRRPAYAPRANDSVPDGRAGRMLKLRKLAVRLRAQAERCVRDLEAQPDTDVETLMRALQVLKAVRLEAMGRRGRGGLRTGPAVTGAWIDARDQAIRTALTECVRTRRRKPRHSRPRLKD